MNTNEMAQCNLAYFNNLKQHHCEQHHHHHGHENPTVPTIFSGIEECHHHHYNNIEYENHSAPSIWWSGTGLFEHRL